MPCTGRLLGLLHKLSYQVGLVHFRTVPKIGLRKTSVRAVATFHSCLASRNLFAAVQSSHKRSVFTTYNVLSATGRRRGGRRLVWVVGLNERSVARSS